MKMFEPLVRTNEKGMGLSLAVGVSHVVSFNMEQHTLRHLSVKILSSTVNDMRS